MKLSSQDMKDLLKYIKFFTLKSAQVIVQSRTGVKALLPSKPHSQNGDWFNLHIVDNLEVGVYMKSLYGDLNVIEYPFCVEVSLKTTDNDFLVLENWCLNLLPEQCDPMTRNVPNIYTRMGLMLKSLLSVTRVTPAYKMSRRQGADSSYVIFYRLHQETPQNLKLGDGYKTSKIGQICTHIGTLHFSVAYRTKMSLSPTQTAKNAIELKPDHFVDNSNARMRKQKKSEEVKDLTRPMRPGPFADPKPKKPVEPQLPEVTRLLAMGKYKPRVDAKPTSELESSDSSKITDEDVNNKKETSSSTALMTSSTSSRTSTASNLKSVDEEYWMKELNAPFATRGPVGELMLFYKQCKKSPPLQSPQKNPTAEEIAKMIAMYELQLPEYDALVHSFCESPDNN